VSDILKFLNEPQREAVTTIEGPVMVIAGAGSGKTRALTHRIAYMIEQGINPFSIMALTFTNKAAKEMKERIMQLVEPGAARNVWMGTFHSIFARILRIEAASLGYTSEFTIYDTDDSKTLINAILKEREIDTKAYPAKYILHRISMAKSALYTPEDYCENADIQEQDRRANKPLIGEIFKTYNSRLKRANAMDFDDILFNTNVLLRDFPDILLKYQRHFEYILVDEYQDTNYAQYLIIKRIAAMRENICVVGDDAQSIYGFRGANIQNILNFKIDYPEQRLIRLEQNYRSTKTIVKAANSVIANNKDQIKKNVWSDKEEGELITLLRATSDNEEGTLVANSIFGYKMSRQLANKDFVILYRTNAQSRSLEEALRKQDIPYKIYGGLSFYDRKEVKDLLAYFRVVINPNDEQALLRIINYPARGIGDTTKQKLQVIADERKCTVWDVLKSLNEQSTEFNMGTINKLSNFVTMIQSFQTQLDKMNAFELAKHITETVGIIKVLKEDESPDGVMRVQNIEELLNAIQEFSDKQVDEVTGEQVVVVLHEKLTKTADLTRCTAEKHLFPCLKKRLHLCIYFIFLALYKLGPAKVIKIFLAGNDFMQTFFTIVTIADSTDSTTVIKYLFSQQREDAAGRTSGPERVIIAPARIDSLRFCVQLYVLAHTQTFATCNTGVVVNMRIKEPLFIGQHLYGLCRAGGIAGRTTTALVLPQYGNIVLTHPCLRVSIILCFASIVFAIFSMGGPINFPSLTATPFPSFTASWESCTISVAQATSSSEGVK